MKRIIFILLLVIGHVCFAQNDLVFKEANGLYNQGKYQDAIDMYESILDNGVHSSELYFNLGNANYKLNKIAPSIYYYEKALQLNPRDKEIQNNLAFAQNMTIDAIEEVPEVGLSKFMKKAINILSFDGWAILAIIMMLLFVGLFILYYFSYTTQRKRLAFIFSNLSLLLMLISLAFAFQKYGMVQKDRPAIVFSQETEVRSEPNLRSSEAFKLHEGTKVQVLDTVNNWRKIKLTDGKTGWVASSDIKLLDAF
ncbi:MAG: SH3 domain-containing protein [Flavobacteriaceae bacterium]|nr:SH3 domain-containing protein [Bacteroidia bacterium]NNL61055.1 SH3 domain-containing protein [Flavobacteriaceae bacterium]